MANKSSGKSSGRTTPPKSPKTVNKDSGNKRTQKKPDDRRPTLKKEE